jgi:hypothetical protein
MWKRLMSGLAAWLLAASAVGAGPAPTRGELRIFPGTMDAVWAAARSSLQSDGWELASEDRATGIIVTDVRDVAFRDLGLVADGLRHRVRLVLRPRAPDQTEVNVTRELFREQRFLWDTARRPRVANDNRVELGILEGIALFTSTAPRVATAVPAPPVTPLPGPVSERAGPSRPPTPDPPQRSPRVTYRVTGSSGPVQVTYRDHRGNNDHHTAMLPWELSFEGTGPAQLYVSAVAQSSANQSVTCEILVDGSPRSQSMSVGAAAVAACSTAMP